MSEKSTERKWESERKWEYRDKRDQGRGFIVALTYDPHPIAENLTESRAKHICDCVNGCQGYNPLAVKEVVGELENIISQDGWVYQKDIISIKQALANIKEDKEDE